MPEESLQEQLKALQDRSSIIDVVCRYAVSIDRHQWQDLESCFAEEIDLNVIRTGRWVRYQRPDLLRLLQGVFETYTATQHISANHQVSIDGDRAVVWSTLNATHYIKGLAEGEFHQQVGYYEYHLIRGRDWRINSVRQVPHWQRGNQQIFDSTLR
ncbi:nuclear transport factor 2 family protein [Amycolatopsis pithecellobii]|uniref:nuclear transport factor 2 family protein n=1 Tax=Amycolatopsis pithecellobii TaxID=664692 RepID=UPI0014087DF6|nr:nuclear transport factor 2 family protein [Amycolatopsis pithecellobii]